MDVLIFIIGIAVFFKGIASATNRDLIVVGIIVMLVPAAAHLIEVIS